MEARRREHRGTAQGVERFAKNLALRLLNEIQNMDADISAFSEVINRAITETETLISAQRKVNKGIEDMRGAIVEVSEEEIMKEFEAELKLDKTEMPGIATQLRQAILPQAPFVQLWPPCHRHQHRRHPRCL